MYHNVHVDSIFSSQEYAQRSAAMTDFRAGKTWVLISTDVLARGIDFVGVQTVISFDFPSSTLDYIHRIGRTGRAGRSGACLPFCSVCVAACGLAGCFMVRAVSCSAAGHSDIGVC